MRKTIATLLTLLALTLVAACGASGGEEADTTTTEAAADKTTTTEEAETTTTEASSGDAVPVDDWAKTFCGDFGTWLDNIKAASDDLGSFSAGDVAAAKASVVKLFSTASDETETLIAAIEDTGAPDIEDGDMFLEDLVGKFNDFNDAVSTAESDAQALSTDDPAAFESEVGDLVATFQAETTKVGTSFAELDTKYPSPELSSALTESCDL